MVKLDALYYFLGMVLAVDHGATIQAVYVGETIHVVKVKATEGRAVDVALEVGVALTHFPVLPLIQTVFGGGLVEFHFQA